MSYLDKSAREILKTHLREFEGVRLESYQDSAGVWTIGYGHTKTARPGMTISHTAAEQLLDEDLAWVDQAMGDTIRVPLNSFQQAALAGLIFNIGASAWKGSTALKRVNNGNMAGAAEAILWWNKATVGANKIVLPGLVRRREAERRLFLTSTDSSVSESVPITAQAEADELKPMGVSKELGIGTFGLLGSIVAMWEKAQEVFPPEWLDVAQQWAPVALAVMFAVIAGNRLYARWVGAR